ncbi:unnamed protein product [Sphagnum balticum]
MMMDEVAKSVCNRQIQIGYRFSFFRNFCGFSESSRKNDGGDEYCGLHNAEKKRRLTFDQVRSLERNFELENKLEPERKMQLAKELGLQPRQVAVWFQNRRARWKTKQLERDYEILTQDYNRLKSELESVRDEKQELQAKVKWLTEKSTTQPEEESAAGCQAAPIGSYVQQQQSSPKLVETTATTLNHQPGATSNESPSQQLTLPEKPSGDSCNFLLPQVDEHGGLPWWDWA